MSTTSHISSVASLMGDPTRAAMLSALMGGRALAAGELAHVAGVATPTASGHLAQLLDGGLVAVEQQGRHRYYRLASPDVASAIEALSELAEQTNRLVVRTGPRDPDLRHARVCYDHLAGARGVELYARMTRSKLIALEDGTVDVTRVGERHLSEFGVNVAELRKATRPLCRTCIDWSERRTHLAGSLGAGILTQLFARRWAYRVDDSRVVRFSPKGEAAFTKLFG